MDQIIEALICAVAAIILLAVPIFNAKRKKGKKAQEEHAADENLSIISSDDKEPIDTEESICEEEPFQIQFEKVSALSEEQENKLVEITDQQILSRIYNVIPNALRVLEDTATAMAAGNLYSVILPPGTEYVRTNSNEILAIAKEMGNNKFKKVLPLIPDKGERIATMSAMNAAMGLASIVVGQYYMKEINSKVQNISNRLNGIYKFHLNDFEAEVNSIITQIETISIFRVDIMENDELRKRKLDSLQTFESKSSKLLEQANKSILMYCTDREKYDYKQYIEDIKEIHFWWGQQNILLEVLKQIAALNYVFYKGTISKEYSCALVIPYINKVNNTRLQLREWHNSTCEHLKINLEEERREKQGAAKIATSFLTLFDEDLKVLQYTEIKDKDSLRRIRAQQCTDIITIKPDPDRYRENVLIIAKSGKFFYLPESCQQITN